MLITLTAERAVMAGVGNSERWELIWIDSG